MLRKNALQLAAPRIDEVSATAAPPNATGPAARRAGSAATPAPAKPVTRNPVAADCTCPACAANGLNLCALGAKAQNAAHPLAAGSADELPMRMARARRTISHPRDMSEFVTVICSGWAASVIALPDGRRQIASFLLPGDLTCSASLLWPVAGRLVEAVTDVSYRQVKREHIKAALFNDPVMFEKISILVSAEREQADRLLVDLGCRAGHERIARQILYLAQRFAKPDSTKNQMIPFPLRHRHLAEATGLTSVHVSKVMTEMRRSGIIALDNRVMTITDASRLREIAHLH